MQRTQQSLMKRSNNNHNFLIHYRSRYGNNRNSKCSLLQQNSKHQTQQQSKIITQQLRFFKHDKTQSRALRQTIQAQKEMSSPETTAAEYLFGLRPVDFSILPPLYRPPPPPPPPTGFRGYVLHFTLAIFVGTFGYFYYNNQNDSYEYWETMQTGGVLPGTYDDDDDDDDDDDEEDEE